MVSRWSPTFFLKLPEKVGGHWCGWLVSSEPDWLYSILHSSMDSTGDRKTSWLCCFVSHCFCTFSTGILAKGNTDDDSALSWFHSVKSGDLIFYWTVWSKARTFSISNGKIWSYRALFWITAIMSLIHRYTKICFKILLGHKTMWTSTNYFLVNLSFTDLLMTIFNGVFNFIYMRDNDWPFGSVYCTINHFIAHYTVIASVLTLTAITLDRYILIF